MDVKRIVAIAALAGLALACLGALALGVLREAPGTNTYALLADALLHGRFDVTRCFDDDCALVGDKIFVIFPPLPAVIILPFVALFGTDFHFFMPLSLLAFAASGFLWWRIAERLTASRDLTALLTLLVLFATPLFFVALRGDRVWFFAQGWGFLFASAAVYFALVGRNALLAGLFIGLAFLSRQMSILYLPFLYVLLLDEDTPLFRVDGAAVKRALTLAAFPLVALGAYLAYNYARFGGPLETGYAFLFIGDFGYSVPVGDFIKYRARELGQFSPAYLLFNAVYMFLQGPHVEFSGRYVTEMTGFDQSGASLFLVTPALLFAFLARWDRTFWFGLLTAGAILGITLLYHSNGYSQYSAQRYALDWLPILLVFLARGVKPEHKGPLTVLVIYSMAVTLGMVGVGALVGGA